MPGSPPRAWGRRGFFESKASSHRFTPTCVGTAIPPIRLPHRILVHPHVRGDGERVANRRAHSTGSPPRAWGRLRRRLGARPATRFTPTCVGTATPSQPYRTPTTVHPHVRGDGGALWQEGVSSLGSPPRAWGRLCSTLYLAAGHRFTPTCVGTAPTPSRRIRVSPVHPHVRGDGAEGAPASLRRAGSPPRAWGRLLVTLPLNYDARFTPTCVGTATAITPSAVEAYGSPPRAWGRPVVVERRVQPLRFTPTCVGTASCPLTSQLSAAVHPHVRGDGSRATSRSGTRYGSPPRAWGRRGASRDDSASQRFTPTCVGTARNYPRLRRVGSVHPHVRGDGSTCCTTLATGYGSPPRAWGRRLLPTKRDHVRRFTPTCVGTADAPPTWSTHTPVHPHVRGDGVVNPQQMVGRGFPRRRCRSGLRRPTAATPECGFKTRRYLTGSR